MTVFYLPRPDAATGPRVGITVSRALGGAVERNRIKRRMREAIRLHFTGLTSSMDVVFNPKKVVATEEFVAIEQEVSRSFEVIEKAAARVPAKERSNAQ
jgi:ribonuclease P protein component